MQFENRVIRADANGGYMARKLAEDTREPVLMYQLVKVMVYTGERRILCQYRKIGDLRAFWQKYQNERAFYYLPKVYELKVSTRGTIATSAISRIVMERVKV